MASPIERSIGYRVNGLTPELYAKIHPHLSSYDDETQVRNLSYILRNPKIDPWKIANSADIRTMINWSRDNQRYSPEERRVLMRVFNRFNLLLDLNSRSSLAHIAVATLEGWRTTAAGIYVQAGLHEKVVTFFKQAVSP